MAVFDHYMRFNIGDYLADTMHLSTFQHGIYVLLIMHYFKRGELPADERALARIAKVALMQWRRHAPPVMALFRIDQNGAPRHARIDAEREASRRLSEKRANAGKSGAYRRWGMANATNTDGNSHDDSRARDSPIAKANSPLPPEGGKRGAGWKNGFGASAAADMQEALNDAEATDARGSDPRVVSIARGVIRG